MDSLLGMIQRDASDQRLYIILHNIDGLGACQLENAAETWFDPCWVASRR